MQYPIPCPRCSYPNLSANTFCGQCGTKLNTQQSTPFFTPGMKLLFGGIGALFILVVIGAIATLPSGSRQARPSALQTAAAQTPTPTPEPSAAEKLARAKQLSSGENTEALGEAVKLLQSIPKEAKEYKEAKPILERTTQKWSRLAAADFLLGPKPENSAWDGRVQCADRYLRTALNDYDSSEYLEWSPVTRVDVKGEPYWATRLKLRAKNAFGAYIVKDVYFFIRRNQVVRVEGL